MQPVRDEVGDHPIYVSVDETTDSLGRLITTAIVAPLIDDTPGIPIIIHCTKISRANGQTIAEFTESALTKLWPRGIRRERVLLFVSDAAPYMKAAGWLLKRTYNYVKLVHVTCLTHGSHRVAEEIRGTYGLFNDVIAETKAVFTKSPSRKRLFQQFASDIPLPPKPIVTRWGEWLKAVSYYSEHFEEVQVVIEQLDLDTAAVTNAKRLWATPNLQCELNFIHEPSFIMFSPERTV